MIDIEQARILDFGDKDKERVAIANIKQTLINLKKVAEEHTKRLFDMKVENERIVEENDKLRRALTRAKDDIHNSSCMQEPYRPHCVACTEATEALGGVQSSEVISRT